MKFTAILIKILTSDAIEALIVAGLKYLLEHKTRGVGKELALSVIDSVAKSQENPTTEDMFADAKKALEQ